MSSVDDHGMAGDLSVAAFVGLNIAGQISMLLLLLAIFLSRESTRHPAFINFCATWILFSLSYVLLSVARFAIPLY